MKSVFVSISLILCWLFNQSLLFSNVIKGKVVDSETNLPIENVSLLNKSNKELYRSDKNGNFSLDIDTTKPNFLLKFYKQGYETETVLIDPSILQEITIRMKPKIVYLPTIEVGANLHNRFDEMQSQAYTIKQNDYQKALGNTLAIALRNQIGMAMSSMGPAPSRPVFRGMSGNKIAFSCNGVNVSDLSGTSPDHALTINPLSVHKVELVRGPKILLYTPNTFGAAIDVQTTNKLTSDNFASTAIILKESIDDGYSGMFNSVIPYKNITLNGTLSYHRSSDLRFSDFVLKNTYNKLFDANFGGQIDLNNFLISANYQNYQNFYGIPGGFVGAHPNGVDIELYKNVTNANLIKHFHKLWLDNISINFSRNYYHHIEKEKNNTVGSEFVFWEYASKIVFNHNKNDFFENGSYGLGLNHKDFRIGGYVFTPKTQLLNLNLFAYEEYSLSDFFLQSSIRFDYTNFKPENKQFMNNQPIPRTFKTFSLSQSILKQITTKYALGINISKTSRTPSIEELYSDGPHLAAYSYEIGNSLLKAENGYGVELFGYFNNESFNFSLASYIYYYDYYIIPRNTGKLNVQQILPIYQTQGVEALIKGLEMQFEGVITRNLLYKGNMTYTEGRNVSTKKYLPMIPPFKSNLEIKYRNTNFQTGLQFEFASKQNKVDEFEEPTEGYFIVNYFAQQMIVWGNSSFNFIFSVDNIFNKTYQNHLSRIKSIYPEPGRNFKFILRVDF